MVVWRDWLCLVFYSDVAILEIKISRRNIRPLSPMSDNACYQQLGIEPKNEDQVLANSNTVISGRAPSRMGGPVMPMPRFM